MWRSMSEFEQTTKPVAPTKKLRDFKQKYFASFDQLLTEDKQFARLFDAFNQGKNAFGGISRRENKTYNADFIEEIEKTIGSVEKIVGDPHQFIKENPLVVEVEKAKRITHHSVKHMAQHTENIASVASDGSIDPKRVLNMFIEDELKIYENRFIMTLIKRLQTFIELRHKYILEHSDTRHSDIVTVTSEVKIGEVTYQMESKLKVIVPSDDEGHRDANHDLLNRLLNIRKRVLLMSTSRFMLDMSKAAPVTDPVLQTNIMRLNYDYQNAYQLWMFINRYEQLGISYKFVEKKIEFDEKYLKQLTLHNLSAYLSVESEHQTELKDDDKVYYYKPKFIKVDLDTDMTDERLFKDNNPFKLENKKETQAQLEAKIRRQQLLEERRIKREQEKEQEKLERQKQKEEAKKLAEQRKLELKKKAEEKKLKEAEKKRLKALQEAEMRRIEKLKQEELRKLEQARLQVAKVANQRKQKK